MTMTTMEFTLPSPEHSAYTATDSDGHHYTSSYDLNFFFAEKPGSARAFKEYVDAMDNDGWFVSLSADPASVHATLTDQAGLCKISVNLPLESSNHSATEMLSAQIVLDDARGIDAAAFDDAARG